MKNLYASLLLSLSFLFAISQPAVSWLRTGAGPGDDEVFAISTLPDGTTFIGGNCYSPLTFDTVHFILPDSANVFVYKLDDNGAPLWTKYFPTPGNSRGSIYGIAAIPDGGCYITGSWSDSIWVDTILLNTDSLRDPFFARLSNNGSVTWVQRGSGGSWWAEGKSVAVSQSGEVYFAGNYYDTLIIDSVTIINSMPASYCSFLAKFDSTGDLLWLKNFQGNTNLINDIALDVQGNLVFLGEFSSVAYVDTFQINDSTGKDIYLGKFNSNGNLLWVRQYGGISNVSGEGFTICPNNDIVITGNYTAPFATFDTIIIPFEGFGDFDGYVARYDENGNIKWVNYQYTPGGDMWNYTVRTISGNTIYFCGFYYDSLLFSSGPFVVDGPSAYLAACDSAGDVIMVKNVTGPQWNLDFELDSSERIFLAGTYEDSLDLPPYFYTTQGGFDFFIAQLNSSSVGIPIVLFNGKLMISPNPATSMVKLTIPDRDIKNCVVEMYDGMGALMMRRQLHDIKRNETVVVDMDEWMSNGIYLLVVVGEGERYVNKIILDR